MKLDNKAFWAATLLTYGSLALHAATYIILLVLFWENNFRFYFAAIGGAIIALIIVSVLAVFTYQFLRKSSTMFFYNCYVVWFYIVVAIQFLFYTQLLEKIEISTFLGGLCLMPYALFVGSLSIYGMVYHTLYKRSTSVDVEQLPPDPFDAHDFNMDSD
jgi:hypothetical protein